VSGLGLEKQINGDESFVTAVAREGLYVTVVFVMRSQTKDKPV